MLDQTVAPGGRAHPDVRLDTSLELLLDADLSGAPVLATVVATAGSTYRKHGARMLIREDDSYLGLLSGGCLEGDLILHAREVRTSGLARAIEYDTRGPDDALFGIGTGCEGAMRILLEPARAGSPAARTLALAGNALGAGRAGVLIMVHESSRVPAGTYAPTDALPAEWQDAGHRALTERATRRLDAQHGGQRERVLVQYTAPAPHLLVCGAGPDAQSVVAAARFLGWRVTVVDHRPAYARADRFPGARVRLGPARALQDNVDLAGCHAAVVMSHHLDSDSSYLSQFAAAGTPLFIGLLGPAARRSRILGDMGAGAARVAGLLRGPVGLDIGASTPEAIALAIVSQIHAWLADREHR